MPLLHKAELYAFEPSLERARLFDETMRERLADSLDYVFAAAGEALDCDASEVQRLIASIRERRQSPHAFGLYYAIVTALQEGEIEEAQALVRELLGLEPCASFNVVPLPDEPPHRRERLRRLLISGYGEASDRYPDEVREGASALEEGMSLLARGFPQLEQEIRELVCDLVLGISSQDPDAPVFNGASAFQLWGAVLLNVRNFDEPIYTALSLAHESGHNLLFGYCTHESLVLNPDDELFDSPLRADPRPMDGIFHATYVSARMHLAAARLRDSGVLSPADEETALQLMESYARSFEQGHGVVGEHGILTDTGRAVMAGAMDYMAPFIPAAAASPKKEEVAAA